MAFVQDDAGAAVATAALAVPFGSNVTAGSVIGGGIRFSNGSNTLSSVAKSAGTATIGAVTLLHNPTDDAAGNSARSALWYAVVTGTGSLTMTYTLGAVGTLRAIQFEASGVDTASPLKGSNMRAQSNPGTGTDAVTSNASGTAGVSDDFVWGWVGIGGVETPTISAGTGFTIGQANTGSGSEYRTTAADTATFTWDSTTADSHCGVMVFAQAAVGGGDPEGSLLAGKLLRGGLLLHGVLVN